jgi:ferredoxin-NADP reductase
LLQKWVPDYRERVMYISGPQGMVTSTERVLRALNVASGHIKTDYFPGL